ncbi:MAG: hypothetical protein H0T42_02390, partial [Deltaproteobacteria bacterium]|nr:hypothetical protein [Deltaproteobacteria bacterium]
MRNFFIAVSVLVLAGCPEKKQDYEQQKPEEVAAAKREAAPPPKPKRNPPPADLGSCKLTVTGGITAEQTSPGGKDATNVAYWYTADERKNMMGVDGYMVSCKGDQFRFSLLPGGGKLDGMPFGPKKFTFIKDKSDGASVTMTFGQATLSDVKGTVEITALDKTHIAGTIDLAGKVVPGNKQIKVTGSFNYVC